MTRWEGGTGSRHIDADSITLELLQSYYNIPLAELAKELGLSLTLLKKICRKFGIQRWPHRQIRSLNKNAQELRERGAVATSPEEHADIQMQLELLEKKKRLVTRGASSGLQSALRNALFLANPEQLVEDDMFDVKIPLAAQQQKLEPQEYSRPVPMMTPVPTASSSSGGGANPMYKMMQHMSRAADCDMLVGSDLLPSEQKQQRWQQQQAQEAAAAAPQQQVSQFSSYMQTQHQQQQSELLLQQQMAAHMSQMALHQQLQMNNYMCVAPAPAAAPAAPAYGPLDSAFDSTPFDEVAALLGMDTDLPTMALPEDFDADFMGMMMETCASGELDGPIAPQQQLPQYMQTGHNMHQQQQQQHGAAFGAYQAPSPYMHMGWTV